MLSRRLLSSVSASAALKTTSLRRALPSQLRSLRCALSTAAVAEKPAESIVFTSHHGDLHIPDTTIWEIAQNQAAANADGSAFICGLTHQNVTFEELVEGAKRVAVALAQDGVRKGDVRLDTLLL